MPPRPERPLVALYSGLVVEGDAISGSLRTKLNALRKWESTPVDAIAFCECSDTEDPDIQVVPTPAELLRHPLFERASLHVFEFGMYYGLFNVANLLPSRALAAVYHNVTPLGLVDDDVVRYGIHRTMAQKHLLARACRIACVSEYNREDLIGFGLREDTLTVLPLPPSVEADLPAPRSARPSSSPVRLLFVGRFVAAKGVRDLMDAIRRMIERRVTGFELRLIGMTEWSDPEIVAELRQVSESPDTSALIQFTPNLPTEDLAAAYCDADVLIMPSYHEGYCVPVVEAFNAACPVIAYDNSNLPSVCGGLGQLVATGDVEALTQSIEDLVTRLRASREHGETFRVATSSGPLAEHSWRDAVQARTYMLHERHDEAFRDFVSGMLVPAAVGGPQP